MTTLGLGGRHSELKVVNSREESVSVPRVTDDELLRSESQKKALARVHFSIGSWKYSKNSRTMSDRLVVVDEY